jgi:hypothetical protein
MHGWMDALVGAQGSLFLRELPSPELLVLLRRARVQL